MTPVTAPSLNIVLDALRRAPVSRQQQEEWSKRIPTLTDDERRQALELLEGLSVSYKQIAEGIDKIALLKPLNQATLTPEQIQALSLEQLQLPETIDAIREYLRMLGYRRHGMRATEVENALRALAQRHQLDKQYPTIAASVDELIALAQYYHLAGLSRLQRRNLFQHHFTVLLKEEESVVDVVDDWLVKAFDTDGLDEDLEAVVIGIRNNIERIGSVPIDREAQGTVAPTIQNWLIDYDYLYPREKTRGPVESNEYFARRQKTISKMSPDEQALLRELLQTVDKLLFPERHGTVEEHDELPRKPLETPKDTGPKRLASVPIKKEAKTLEEKLMSQFEGSVRVPGKKMEPAVFPAKERTAPLKPDPVTPGAQSASLQLRGKPADERKIETMKQQLRSMGPALVTQFHDVIAPKGARASKETHIAALLLLAETNKLEDVIRSQGMHDWFVDYLKSMNKPEILEGFRIAQTSPKFMRIFLAWVLQDRAGLPEAEAARFGARIVSTLRKQGNEKYAQIAYYDEGKGRFTWN